MSDRGRTMKKRAISVTAALTVTLAAAKPADACTCGPDCLPWLTPVAWAMGAGMVGLYGYGTYYYAAGDLESGRKSMNYYGSELILHGSLGALWTGATLDAAKDGQTGTALVTGSLAALHLTLGTNGMRGLLQYRDQFHPSDTAVTWGIGTLTGVNALVWTSGMAESHGRTYGFAEMAINTPFLVGFATLAKDRFDSGATGPALAYSGLAAISGIYIAHGAKTVLFPKAPQLDVLGDVTPTMIGDGASLAPGLATAGTW